MEESIRSTGGSIITYIRYILGTYTPTDPTSMAGADWEYIFAGLVLLLSLFFIFKFITLVFKR